MERRHRRIWRAARRARVVVGLCLVVSAGCVQREGEPQQVQRRQEVRSRPAASRIWGVVRQEVNGRTIAGARVTLSGVTRQEVLTNRLGVFSFDRLQPGTYSVSAGKAGFVSHEFGQRRVGEPGRRISIATDPSIIQADITITRGGVVGGQVTDETGEPMPDVAVQLFRPGFARGRPTYVRVDVSGGGRTDERGRFRVFGVPPGEYVIRGDLTGELLGPADSPRRYTYAERFFPSAPNADAAVRVRVESAQAHELASPIVLVPVPVVAVSGIAVDATGERLVGRSGVVRLTEQGGSEPRELTALRPDGSFEVRTPAPAGRYVLSVSVSQPGGIGVEGRPQLGTAHLVLGAEDVSDLVVRVQRGTDLSGRVEVAGRPVSELPRPLHVYAQPKEPDGALIGSMAVPVGADGRFVLRNVFEPSWIVTDLVAGAGWAVDRVYHNGQDVSESGVAPGATADTGDVVVVLTPMVTVLKGGVRGADGQPAPDSVVLVFAEDEMKWLDARGRYIRTLRQNPDATFEVTGLPDGVYFVVAVDSLGADASGDPSLLRTLRTRASRVDLRVGIASHVELQRVVGE